MRNTSSTHRVSGTSPRHRRGRTALAAVACVALVAGCGDGDDGADETAPASPPPATTEAPADTASPDTTDAATTTAPAPTTSPTTTGHIEAIAAAVNVYWGWSIPTHYVTPERLGAGGRTVADGDTEALAAAALDALLAGPNEIESEIGMLTAIPDGTRLLGVEVDDGAATVDLDAAFAESTGSLEETTRLAQVVFTATAIDGIDRVRFAIDGAITDPVLSHGFVVGDGLTRDDFAEVRPLILVESPTPGAQVEAGPVVVQGESNTFEATVQWLVADDDGEIVDEGFTTATAGMGTWGTFEFTVDLTPYDGQRVALVVFESSPEDGSQRNVVEVPVDVG